jgi:F-type H+-transporting ATPase subunit b
MNRRSSFLFWAVGPIAVALAPAPVAAAEGGLEIFPDPGQLIVLIVLFLLLILPVNVLLLRPLLKVLDERSERIDGARQRASELSERAEELLTRYRAALHEARAAAEGDDRRVLVERAREEQGTFTREARAEAERDIEQARGEVISALDDARTSLRQRAEELARDAVARILGRALA